MDSPILYKRTTSGGIQTWKISVLPLADGTAMVVTTFGLLDGKQQRQEEHIKTGKNAGKANATTPLQQAMLEATAEHNSVRQFVSQGKDGRNRIPGQLLVSWAWCRHQHRLQAYFGPRLSAAPTQTSQPPDARPPCAGDRRTGDPRPHHKL